MKLQPKQLRVLLATAFAAGIPVLVQGEPGVGKSDVVAQAAADAGARLLVSHPAVEDPTDAKGFPVPGEDAARFLPFGTLNDALRSKDPTIWFLDDLGQSSPAVQAAYMQLLLAGRCGEHVLPECVTFVAATNGRSHRAGVSGILEPVKSRFGTIVELVPSLDDWCAWAVGAGMPPVLIAFLRFKPDLLCAFNPTADLENSPSPRTWAMVGKWMNAGLPPNLETVTFAGAVGLGAATEYCAFLGMARELVHPDRVIVDPEGTPIPTKLDALFAVSAALGQRANEQNFGRIMRYLDRMRVAGYAEFAALALQDAVKRDPAVTNTPAYITAMSTGFGAVFQGAPA